MTDMKYISICCIFLSSLFLNPNIAFTQSDGVVAAVGSHQITYSELVNSFTEGKSGDITLTDLENYLPLYLDYKAKLLFAEDNGYFEDSTVVQEHELYSKQAAFAYWLNHEIRPELFNKFYERAQYELKSYHVLVEVPRNATEEQEEEILNKMKRIKREIDSGLSIVEADKKYSTVRGGRSMGGDLPWVSAGMFVQEFENQLFEMEPGEVSEPFKSQFGYHIVKLQAKRPRTPARNISHIYVRSTRDSAAVNKINEAYAALENGSNWNDVVSGFTEDGPSAQRGGNIGWVSMHSNFPPSFLELIHSLEPNKKFSEPIKTIYGYHIFKVDSVQTFESEEAKRKAFMTEFEKTNYFQESNSFAVDYLIKTYGSAAKPSVINNYLNFIHSKDSLAINSVELDESLGNAELFSFNSEIFSMDDLHRYLQRTHGDKPAVNFNENHITEFSEKVVDERIIDFTVKSYPAFQKQIENYLNGLVVYKINDDFMWSAETVDSTRLRKRYEQNPRDYTYPRRPYFYMVSSIQDTVVENAMEFLKQGNDPDSIRKYVKNAIVSSDSLTTMQDEPFNRLQNIEEGSFSDIFEFNRRKTFFYVRKWLPARKMTFEEAFGRLLTEFQPEREAEWLNKLRSSYNVKSDMTALRKLYNQNNTQ